ncbi:alpha/beta hydrolase [Bradyrhizobium sp. KBS0727]|uniref:alpha/beta hydrolase family protein n=1 Tax=unclassified Bradyrhizobium TaxID=2631580 RepID=UPI00110E7197|nr:MULTISPECIES: alpha/beta hydrolase [unclassified Bradyrhizobium]QDW37793.1 alpha/beta hydrolase [Bradyrhizobium sp. KBS0725]QDW44397.1 alpha/beta hydrolase [Bradyrhizobium sp. KBS0727]
MDPSFPEMPEWGWRPWPDSEEYSYFFLRVLTTAQGGAATISECISASRNIVPGDNESWFRAWNKLAERNRARADQAFERRSLQAAASNWLRASNYYRTSELFLAADDGRRRAAILNMRQCAQSYLRSSSPKGEILRIPFGKSTMEAYYLRANGIARQPVVVCLGGGDDLKEDLLCSIPRIASENGYSVLLVDVIGAGTGIRDTNTVEPVVEVEDVIGHWIDHLWDRSDVDGSRLAIYGIGLGGAYATRYAARDRRIAAAVCDGGLWDYRERLFVERRLRRIDDTLFDSRLAARLMLAGPLQTIDCPYLVTMGAQDRPGVLDTLALVDAARSAGLAAHSKVFTPEETGSFPDHVDNPALVYEYVFDWLRGAMQLTRPRDVRIDGQADETY